MLDLAIKYKDELNSLWVDTLYKEKYKYVHNSSWQDLEIDFKNDTWNRLQMVSVKDGKVIGYFKVSIDRDTLIANNLLVMNFYDINYTFSKDFKTFITDLFEKYNFNKLTFNVVLGNKAEKMYDKYIELYGGRIVGTLNDDCKLFDGKLYDSKLYDITKKEYLERKLTNEKIR